MEVFGGDFVLEEAQAVGYAAQGQAFGNVGIQRRTDDKFCRTAADVDNQHFAPAGGEGVDHAGINQPRLFAPGDDFDGETQCRFGLGKEICDVFGDAECIGCHGAHLLGAEAAQAFAEFCQAVQSLFLRGCAEVFLFVQTGGKTDHLFEGIDDF